MVRTVMVDWSLLRQGPLFHVEKFKKGNTVKAFIQARIGSTRLPRKIYEVINGAPMLYHTINMTKKAKLIDDVIVISPEMLPDLPDGIPGFVYTGPQSDVLGRYHAALKAFPCDYVVRITSDCPLLDPHLIDFVIASTLGFDYGSNVLAPSFPDGMDVEVISAKTLDYLNEKASASADREHVTTYIRNRAEAQVELSLISVQAFQDQSCIKLSVDTKEDLHRVREMERLCQK